MKNIIRRVPINNEIKHIFKLSALSISLLIIVMSAKAADNRTYNGMPDKQISFVHLKKPASQQLKTLSLYPYLHLQLVMDSINTDDIVIQFDNNASRAYNVDYDAPYFQGFGDISLCSRSSDGMPLVINTIPFPKETDIIHLNVNTKASGIYKLVMKDLVDVPQLFDIWLIDSYANDSLDMRHNTTYAFNVLKSDSNTYGTNRFSLVIRQDLGYAYHLLNLKAQKIANENQVNIEWNTENEQNYTRFSVERSTGPDTTFKTLNTDTSAYLGAYNYIDKNPVGGENLYRLKQMDFFGSITYSKTVQVFFGYQNYATAVTTTVYPNPAGGTINIAIQSASPGSYQILITNMTGASVKSLTASQNICQADVSGLSPGTYLIKVINRLNSTELGNTKFVKL